VIRGALPPRLSQARRVAYNNKLTTDSAALAEKLTRATLSQIFDLTRCPWTPRQSRFWCLAFA
jgi:hypothetical protein